MSNTVIQVTGLSKRYQLGTIGYGSLQHDLKAWWAKARGKEDPNVKIGETSRLDRHGEFWALRDVGFEVAQGDRVGIIGRNGAGKSTLLKLLSRVTSPTSGSIKVRGRIASLLEVGTGFHPELTGRENVFLNGAILGMKRREIQAKFDEIVEFAGVDQFIDTPVKRYSSGMYVRLAFSVAAHLDSEILIIDEVLAVGDAEFQKKCLGKMEDVSKGQGKTILFVSHSLSMVERLCNRGILLHHGSRHPTSDEGLSSVFAAYTDTLESKRNETTKQRETDAEVLDFRVMNSESITYSSGILFQGTIAVRVSGPVVDFVITLFSEDGRQVLHQGIDIGGDQQTQDGIYKISVQLPARTLNVGLYTMALTLGRSHRDCLFHEANWSRFVVRQDAEYALWNNSPNPGLLFLPLRWTAERI